MPDHLHLLVKQMISHLDVPTAPAERCAGVDFKDCLTPNPARVSVPAVGDGQYNISQLMYTIKSYFINESRKRCNIDYSIWQKRFNTRIVDNEERLRNTIEYIKSNQEKAGLPEKYKEFPYMYFNRKKIFELFKKLSLASRASVVELYRSMTNSTSLLFCAGAVKNSKKLSTGLLI